MATWKEHAKAVIKRALAEAAEQGLDAEATRKHVDAAYPFGERRYYPYTAWLAARRELLRSAGMATTTRVSAAEQAKLDAWNAGEPIHVADPLPDQGTLL